ncbi:MAG TPA: hypothetical protein VIF60_08955 [Burkholderiaceae bacterium]
MRKPTAFALIAMSVLAPSAFAEQGVLHITPRFSDDQPLMVELRNFSKLPVRLTQATLKFQSASGGNCSFDLPHEVALAPSSMLTVSLAGNADVVKCVAPSISAAGAARPRMSVRVEREGGESPVAGATQTRVETPANAAVEHPAELSYQIQVGQRSVSEKTVWHFSVQ